MSSKEFEKINSRIGATIEMTPDVYEILGTLYNEEEVLVKDIEVISNDEYKVRCVFPEYKKSQVVPDHVSVSQMQDAVMHASYMVMGLYIKNNPDKSPFDFATFLSLRMHFLYYWENQRRFIKKLQFGEDAYLLFSSITFEKKWAFLVATVKLKWTSETFVRGEIIFLLEEKYL